MVPKFALHFLADEISLDHRRGKAWVTIGTAAFNSGQFAGEITALRAMGEAAARARGIPFETKLVLPSDQVKVLRLREGNASAEAVGLALEGATPYALSELRFDWKSSDTETRIAAVAQETLDEAAAFATEHGLAPVAFVAFPENGWDGAEAFFGTNEGAQAERDTQAYARWEDGEEIIDDLVEEAPAVEAEAYDSEVVEATEDTQPPEPAEVEPDVQPEPSPEPRVLTDKKPAAAAFQSRRSRSLGSAAELNEVTMPPQPALKAAPAPADDGRTIPPMTRPPEPLPAAATPAAPTVKTPQATEPVPEASVLAASLRPKPAAGEFAFQSQRAPGTAAGLAPPAEHAPMASSANTPASAALGAPRQAKPRFMGLILTALLIVALLAVAAFATIREDGLAGLWNRVLPSAPDAPVTALSVPDEVISAPEVVSIAPTPLEPSLLDPPQEVLPDTIAEEAGEADVLVATPLSETDLERIYAATGIWPLAPEAPRAPLPSELETIYITSIDTDVSVNDAVALAVPALDVDTRPPSQPLPPAPGLTFRFDEKGLLLATPEGALSPQGYRMIAGRPPIEPPLRIPEGVEGIPESARLAGIRPNLRPANLAENYERLAYGGLTLAELAGFRPKLRPESAQVAKKSDAPNAAPTESAVANSLRPETRPENFDVVIARARAAQPAPSADGTTTTAAAAAPAPTVRSSGPTRASVARAATTENAIRLRRVNLIGVYGTPSNRSALVRLANGRFIKVQVGGRLDGGRVSAISESSLRYQKGGRNITLEIPS
ncbi:MAG: hypothetical protein MK180_08905 [Rhodobacteraceae bacterium]|nr:hypothetical protein [Paracoccaceae bacterium]